MHPPLPTLYACCDLTRSIHSNMTTHNDSTIDGPGAGYQDACTTSTPFDVGGGWIPRILMHVHTVLPGDTLPLTNCANQGGFIARPGPSSPDSVSYLIARDSARNHGGPAPIGIIADPSNIFVFDSTGASGNMKTYPRTGARGCHYP